MRHKSVDQVPENFEDSEDETDDFQVGVWLRHRRIDGALNRVPHHFYAVRCHPSEKVTPCAFLMLVRLHLACATSYCDGQLYTPRGLLLLTGAGGDTCPNP